MFSTASLVLCLQMKESIGAIYNFEFNWILGFGYWNLAFYGSTHKNIRVYFYLPIYFERVILLSCLKWVKFPLFFLNGKNILEA